MTSDDIVERLRLSGHPKDATGGLMHEAADEIERLRADIDKHLSEYHDSGLCGCALEGSR